jgi:hypothetical protein
VYAREFEPIDCFAMHEQAITAIKKALATPKRKWVGLTDAEWSDLYEAHHDKYNLPKQGSPDGMDYERAIEAKLKELNHD